MATGKRVREGPGAAPAEAERTGHLPILEVHEGGHGLEPEYKRIKIGPDNILYPIVLGVALYPILRGGGKWARTVRNARSCLLRTNFCNTLERSTSLSRESSPSTSTNRNTAGQWLALLRHSGGRLTDDVALVMLYHDRQREPARAPAPFTPRGAAHIEAAPPLR